MSFKGIEDNLSPDKRFEFLEDMKDIYIGRISSSDDTRIVDIKDRNKKDAKGIIIEEENECGYIYRMYSEDGSDIGFISAVNINDNQLYISHLRANYKEYRGIGSELVKAVIKKSLEKGFEGQFCVDASNNLELDVGYYRKSTSPVPFYYKLGFRSIDPIQNYYIKKGMEDLEKHNIYTGPSESSMFLDIKQAKENFFS